MPHQQPATVDAVNPLRRRIIEDIVEAILEEYEFKEDNTVVMDFACGTFMASTSFFMANLTLSA